jgi:hypothetical protein
MNFVQRTNKSTALCVPKGYKSSKRYSFVDVPEVFESRMNNTGNGIQENITKSAPGNDDNKP